jgi:hypothetical protein
VSAVRPAHCASFHQLSALSTRVLSLVLPTTWSLLLCDYAHIFPELFLNLYYFGGDLRPSLYNVWGKSEEVRKHTGLLSIDRREKQGQFSIPKLLHSPPGSRPLGVHLPIASSICGCCSHSTDEGTWVLKKRDVPNGRESIFVYRSQCCGVELQVAIFPYRRRTICKNGTVFTEEDWNFATRSFEFKESTMVRMKVLMSCRVSPLGFAQQQDDPVATSYRPGCADYVGHTLDNCREGIARKAGGFCLVTMCSVRGVCHIPVFSCLAVHSRLSMKSDLDEHSPVNCLLIKS